MQVEAPGRGSRVGIGTGHCILSEGSRHGEIVYGPH